MTGVPKVVGVVGGGRMGAGIAQVFAVAGARVTIVEEGTAADAAARERVAAGLARAAERGKLQEAPGGVLERIDFGPVPSTAELVVEAVPEDAGLKARVLAAAEAVVGGDAVLATNTSSLSIGGLAEALARPGAWSACTSSTRCRPATWSRWSSGHTRPTPCVTLPPRG